MRLSAAAGLATTMTLIGCLLAGCASGTGRTSGTGSAPGDSNSAGAPAGPGSTTGGMPGAAPGSAGTSGSPGGGATGSGATGSGSTGSGSSGGSADPGIPAFSPPPASYVPSATERAAAATCPTSTGVDQLRSPVARRVPTGLPVAWVLECRILSTDGTPTTVVAARSTTDPAPLVAALQGPSTPQRPGVVCPMFAVLLPYFALVQPDGQVFLPKLPVDNCGRPRDAVLTALNLLKFTEIARRPVN
jgi:hypothetical protein